MDGTVEEALDMLQGMQGLQPQTALPLELTARGRRSESK
jgi:hypothetical protein